MEPNTITFQITNVSPSVPNVEGIEKNENKHFIGLSREAMLALFGTTQDLPHQFVSIGKRVFKAISICLTDPKNILVNMNDQSSLARRIKKKTTLTISKVEKNDLLTDRINANIEPYNAESVLIEDKKHFKKCLIEQFSDVLIKKFEKIKGDSFVFEYKGKRFTVTFDTKQESDLEAVLKARLKKDNDTPQIQEDKRSYALVTKNTKLKLRRNLFGAGDKDIIFLEKVKTADSTFAPIFYLDTKERNVKVSQEKLNTAINELFLNKITRPNHGIPFKIDDQKLEITLVALEDESGLFKFSKFQHHRLTDISSYNLNSDKKVEVEELVAEPIAAPQPKEEANPELNACMPTKTIQEFLEEKGMCGVPPGLVKAGYATLAAFGPQFLREEAEKRGVKGARGILFYGPPGNGKTLFARYLIKWLGINKVIERSGSEMLNCKVGETEANIRNLFRDAIKDWEKHGEKAPITAVFVDEIDGLIPDRSKLDANHEVNKVNQMLTSLEKVLSQMKNVLFIGATNLYGNLDPAIKRWGRLGVHIEIPNPDKQLRIQLFDRYLKPIKQAGLLEENVNSNTLAEQTPNFSAASIQGVVESVNDNKFAQDVDLLFKKEMDQTKFKGGGSGKIGMRDFEAQIAKLK